MLTQEDLQAMRAIIKEEAGALIKAEGDRLDLKIEASHEFNKKAHAEIMEKLFESNELNGKQLTDHEKRIERLEEHTGLTKS